MECLMTGASQISLTDFEDCNKTPSDDCSISEKCCCFHKMNLNFDFSTDIQNQNISIIPVTVIPTVLFSNMPKPLNFNANFYTNLPPPSGFDLLKIVQVFRL